MNSKTITKTIIYYENKTIVILTDVHFAVRKLIPSFLNFIKYLHSFQF